MTPEYPRHGKYAGWQRHIKTDTPVCEPCAEARRAYQRDHSYDLAAGKPRRIDPTPTRDHLQNLVSAGMTLGRIAEVSGVHPHTVEQIWQGTRRKMSADHAAWLLAVTFEPSDTGLVSAVGSTRRLQALARLGWSADAIATAARAKGHDLEAASLKGIRVSRRESVRTRTHDAIAAAYEELSMTLPTFGRGVNSLRTRALRAGFAPPLAWDNIDDPDARPHGRRTGKTRLRKTDIDPIVIDRVLAGDRLEITYAERREIVKRARAMGWSEETIERRTGITKATDPTRFGDAA